MVPIFPEKISHAFCVVTAKPLFSGHPWETCTWPHFVVILLLTILQDSDTWPLIIEVRQLTAVIETSLDSLEDYY